MEEDASAGGHVEVPVISLGEAPGEKLTWGRPTFVVFAWAVVELLFVTNAWQVSSKLRVAALRLFGASIGRDVVFRPRTRVKFPWNLTMGDDCWIGEGVWIHNQDKVRLGSNVVLSQESMITTGSHALRTDMGLITSPVEIKDGAWVTSRCVVTGGVIIGISAVVAPASVVNINIPAGEIWAGNPIQFLKLRFPLVA